VGFENGASQYGSLLVLGRYVDFFNVGQPVPIREHELITEIDRRFETDVIVTRKLSPPLTNALSAQGYSVVLVESDKAYYLVASKYRINRQDYRTVKAAKLAMVRSVLLGDPSIELQMLVVKLQQGVDTALNDLLSASLLMQSS
jgi:hypothetical protein